jgi:acyl-CoA dehydrogenase
MIHLEVPKKFKPLLMQARQVADNVFRPISRKYDRAEHTYAKELDALAALLEGVAASGGLGGAGAAVKTDAAKATDKKSDGPKNGANMATALGTMELSRGDVGLLLTIPRQGLGNAAIAAVATPAQKERFGKLWAAMAITEPGAGSDSAAIRATARRDGDEWVLNGEKIYVTCGQRADAVVVWASLDLSLGRSAIKSFVVEKGTPGMTVPRLDHKLGIRASDTATVLLQDCRIPADNILGSADIDTQKSFAGVMQTFDNTRPIVAAQAIGIARAALEYTKSRLEEEGHAFPYDVPKHELTTVQQAVFEMEANLEAARLLTWRAANLGDLGIRNSLQASMCKAKAGRAATLVTQKCVELLGPVGYSKQTLVEKWMRDSKITDLFEGTGQIQMLIIARNILGYSRSELK